MAHKYSIRFLLTIVTFIVLYMIRTPIISKEITIRSSDKLDRTLSHYAAAVILLYDRNDSTCCNNMQKMFTIFRQASRDNYYRNAELPFLVVDMSNKRLADQLCDEWRVNQFPAIVICDQGQVVMNEQGNVAALYHVQNRNQLTRFIDNTIGDQLQEIICQKDEDRQRRLDDARIQFYESPSYPLAGDYAGDYSWAYPYWGYGYGYPWGPGPALGIGFTFGGSW